MAGTPSPSSVVRRTAPFGLWPEYWLGERGELIGEEMLESPKGELDEGGGPNKATFSEGKIALEAAGPEKGREKW